MTVAQSGGGRFALDRLGKLAFDIVPYFALGIAVAVTVIVGPAYLSTARYMATLGTAGLAGAWMLWMVTLHPEWAGRNGLMGVYYGGLLVLTAVLVALAPWFGFFVVAGYVHAFHCLRGRWRVAAVAAMAVLTAIAQIGGFRTFTGAELFVLALFITFNLLAIGTFTFIGAATAEQNEERAEIIAKLAEANRRLEAAMEENAGLHAQLLTQAREAGVADERQRMAREIHDTVAQGLTGVITQLQAAERAGEDPTRWQRHLDTARSLARESLSEARRSVQAIRPEPLENARLSDALAEVVNRCSGVNEIAVDVTTTGTARPVHPEIEVALLRTAQEALANVAKHADASRVGLTLSYMKDLVTLDVRDDGIGFDRDAVQSNGEGGFGLAAMRQRITGLYGRMVIESEPGEGTVVSASLPAVPVGDAG